ncbi:MAG: patatin-like phospholipase family protein [Planctomycetaceae bacterium]
MSYYIAHAERRPQLAIALGGGGARAAYQVGVLKGIADRFPNLMTPLLTGVSAGAINVAHLANHTGTFQQKCADLKELWENLTFENVFTVEPLKLLSRIARVGLRLTVGLPPGVPQAHGMVDTSPLREFLHRALHTETGSLPGIAENIRRGELAAVAITALNYRTGETITFVEGKQIEGWERPLRKSVHESLTVEHVMGSAALPLFFPAVQIDDDWFGDGGIRQVAPLSPAIHLGAERLLVLSTHYEVPHAGPGLEKIVGPPSPAVVLGALYNAVFLDQLDQDVLQMERINELIRFTDPQRRNGFRDVKTTVIRPHTDIGAIANRYEHKLPKTFRYFMRRFGSGETKQQDFISTVMFHPEFLRELITVGEQDAVQYAVEIAEFLQT